jgi:flagellar hook-associated protein 2
MPITSAGLVSGIDYNSIISQIQAAEQQPIQQLQARQTGYQTQISALLSLSTSLSTFAAVATSVNNPANFNTRTASVTKTTAGVSLLSTTAASTATTGSYKINVLQLAQAQKVASQGFVDQNTTSVASGAGTFKFKVGNSGTQSSVAVSSSTTLQGLRDAINSSAGSVTATIVNDGTGSNPYRLVLTANNSGSENSVTITNNDTTLDFTNKKVEAAYAFTTNSFAGTVSSNAGNNYTGTTNKTLLVKAVTGGATDTATYKYSIDGGITYLGYGGVAYNASALTGADGAGIVAASALTAIDGSGATNEGVQIGFGATGTLAVGDQFSVDVFSPEFQKAQDAVVKIDNTTLTKNSNTISDAIQGVTLNLSQADSTNGVTLNISSDASGLSDKIKNFVSAYNDVYKAINTQLTFDPKATQAGPLLADPSVRAVKSLLRNVVTGSIPGLTTGISNLSQIGITSDGKTGVLTVDDSKLSTAIASNPDGVKRLFLGLGTATNSAISFVGLGPKTGPGTYGIAISVAPQKAVLGGVSDVTFQDLSSTGLSNAEVLSFTFSKDYTSTTPTTTALSITLSAGSKINDIVNALNSAFASKGAALSASNDSGRLKLTSTNYGKDILFTVVSDQAGTTQTGIGSVGLTAQGADVVGTINGHTATGKGNVLTSHSGFGEDGLSISTETTTTGLFGAIAVTLGVGDQLVNSLDAYTNPVTGVFFGKTKTLQGSIDGISKNITQINDRITSEGDRLRAQFANLESLLGQFQATSNFLTNALNNLPGSSPSSSRSFSSLRF